MLADAAARARGLAGLVLVVGAAGALVLLVVLVRSAQELLAWALALLALAYGITLAVRRGAVDEASPLVAVGLLLCGELAAWSLDERLPVAAERAVVRRRVLALAALAGAGLAASALVVAVAAAPAGRGLGWTTLGAAAAVAVVGAGVALARRAG